MDAAGTRLRRGHKRDGVRPHRRVHRFTVFKAPSGPAPWVPLSVPRGSLGWLQHPRLTAEEPVPSDKAGLIARPGTPVSGASSPALSSTPLPPPPELVLPSGSSS